MRKFYTLILSALITLVLVLPSNVFAQNNALDLDGQLLQMGVPQELIELWSDELKNKIMQNAKQLETYEKVSSNKYVNESLGFMGLSDYSILGNIPEDMFDFYITIFHDGINGNQREQLTVVLTAKWLPGQMPVWRLTDPYGASFDGDIFRIVDNSAYYEDRYTWTTSKNTWHYHQSGTTFAYTSSNGVGFNADIKGDNIGLPLYVHQQTSSGLFQIEGKQQGAISGSSQIQANYYHVKGLGTIGLSFFGMGIDFSGWAPHDTRGTTKSFNY